jgi:preprotein translocase subunit SecA
LPKGQRASEQYNANIRKYTLQYAIAEPLQRLVNYYNDTTTTTKTNNKQWQYPEFTNVIKQHFLQSAKRIEQQLQDWTTATATTGNKNDPALIAIAHEIRQNLAILQSQDENEKQLLRQQQQQLDLETKPKSRPPKPAETIELLDDDE